MFRCVWKKEKTRLEMQNFVKSAHLSASNCGLTTGPDIEQTLYGKITVRSPGTTGAVTPVPPQNSNRIHRFY
jgi:hypothetical protein